MHRVECGVRGKSGEKHCHTHLQLPQIAGTLLSETLPRETRVIANSKSHRTFDRIDRSYTPSGARRVLITRPVPSGARSMVAFPEKRRRHSASMHNCGDPKVPCIESASTKK